MPQYAAQSAMPSRMWRSCIMDVAMCAFGIETAGGLVEWVLRRNTTM
eukprot:SAG11_NODE_35538_length_266_cov_0.616766_1_plen_46_part_10